MGVVIRATVVFWLLWVILRATGKRELAEMTPFELILLMVFGDLVQQGVTGEDQSLTGAALSITTMALWAIAFSYLVYRRPFFRRHLESTPTIVVYHGDVDERALALQRVTREELLAEARIAGVADLASVSLAVLESNGKLSFVTETTPDTANTPDEANTPNEEGSSSRTNDSGPAGAT